MNHRRQLARALLLSCVVVVNVPVVIAGPLSGGDPQAGRKLYWNGINAQGQPINGMAQGDIKFTGDQFSCVSCHRPSGFGSSEGGHYVPPISGPILFNPARADRARRFKEMFQEAQPSSFWAQVREPRLRPAYDEQSLAKALRGGLNPKGEKLNPVMPRYEIDDRDMANLNAFLQTLSAEIDPGVGDKTIHFATIVTENADPAERDAMLETMELFFTWMNKDTEGDLQHPTFSPGYRSDFLNSYRHWKLHVWTLSGTPDTWPQQLEAYYQERSVFALVSGLVRGPWERIGDFCNSRQLPCIFPNTQLPRTDDSEYDYSLYFSAGLALEARALAKHLSTLATPPKRIHQLWLGDAYGEIPALAFSTSCAELLPGTVLENIASSNLKELEQTLLELSITAQDVLVLWPGEQPREALDLLARIKPGAALLALPSNALEPAKELLGMELARRTVFTYPYEVPTRYHPRKFRVRAWMHSRRLKVTHPRLQYQTYYALTLVQYGLVHLLGDFHRDYLIELIEHEAENKLNPGTHPALALGPGQRFASKGAYIVELDATVKGGFKARSEWIIP